jgi:hypothetical protein
VVALPLVAQAGWLVTCDDVQEFVPACAERLAMNASTAAG